MPSAHDAGANGMTERATAPGAGPAGRVVPVVRELRLRRRRTNVPWIYLVYHVDPKPPRAGRPSRRRSPLVDGLFELSQCEAAQCEASWFDGDDLDWAEGGADAAAPLPEAGAEACR
jgi:hypothetical protein